MEYGTDVAYPIRDVLSKQGESMKYKVRDGFVQEGDAFWWLYEGGPEKVDSSNWEEHDYNLKDYPEVYQIKEPVYKVIQEGIYEGEFVYEHEERFKLMDQGKHTTKKPKTERKRPEFTFEDGTVFCKFVIKYCTHSGRLVYLSERFVKDLIVVLTEEPTGEEQTRFAISKVDKFLRVTRDFQKSYTKKEFRKKLKLYIKWLQSEMSRQESFK